MQARPARDCLTGFETLLPACGVTLPNPLIHANAGALGHDAYRRYLFWLNAARDVHQPAVQLGRYGRHTYLDGSGLHRIFTDGELVADHLAHRDEDLAAAAHHRPDQSAPGALEVAAPCLFACHAGVNVWSHWLIDTLPRILLAEAAFPGRFTYAVPAPLADPASPRFLARSVQASLEVYGIAPHRLLRLQPGLTYRFDALFDITGLAADGFHPGAVAALRRAIPPPRDPPRLLAAMRGPGDIRPIMNHPRLIDLLRAHGASFQDPGATPFAEKLAAFAHADIIVGDLGSNFATTIFAKPGAAIVSLAPSLWIDNYFTQFYQRLDIYHADVRGLPFPRPGDAAGHHPHAVHPDHLAAALDAAARARASPPGNGPFLVDGRPIARRLGPVLFRVDYGEGGNAERYRTGTFSAPEGHRTWSLGPASGLRLPLVPDGDFWIELKGVGFIAQPKLPWRPLAIAVNGTEIAGFDTDEITHLHAHVPRERLAGARHLDIEFRHPVCPSPQSLGASGDTRPLGFMFEQVAIRARAPD